MKLDVSSLPLTQIQLLRRDFSRETVPPVCDVQLRPRANRVRFLSVQFDESGTIKRSQRKTAVAVCRVSVSVSACVCMYV